MSEDERKEIRAKILSLFPLRGWHLSGGPCHAVCSFLLMTVSVEADIYLIKRGKGLVGPAAEAAARKEDDEDDDETDDEESNDNAPLGGAPVLLTDFWPEAASHLVEHIIKPANVEPAEGEEKIARGLPGSEARQDAAVTAAILLSNTVDVLFGNGRYPVLLTLMCEAPRPAAAAGAERKPAEAPRGRKENRTLFARLLNAALCIDYLPMARANGVREHWFAHEWPTYKIEAFGFILAALSRSSEICALAGNLPPAEEAEDAAAEREAHEGESSDDDEEEDGEEDDDRKGRKGAKGPRSPAAANQEENNLLTDEARALSLGYNETTLAATHAALSQWKAIETNAALVLNRGVPEAAHINLHSAVQRLFTLCQGVTALLQTVGPSRAMPLRAKPRGSSGKAAGGGKRRAGKPSEGDDSDDDEAGEDDGFVITGILEAPFESKEGDDDDDNEDEGEEEGKDRSSSSSVTALDVLRTLLAISLKCEPLAGGLELQEIATLGSILAVDEGQEEHGDDDGGDDEDDDGDKRGKKKRAGGKGSSKPTYRKALAADKSLTAALFSLAVKSLLDVHKVAKKRVEEERNFFAVHRGIGPEEPVPGGSPMEGGCDDDSSKWSQEYERRWQKDTAPNEFGAEQFFAGMTSVSQDALQTYTDAFRLIASLTLGQGVHQVMKTLAMPTVTKLLAPPSGGDDKSSKAYTGKRVALQVLMAVVKADNFQGLLKPVLTASSGSKKPTPVVGRTFTIEGKGKFSYPDTPARQIVSMVLPCLASDSLAVQHAALMLIDVMAGVLRDESYDAQNKEPSIMNRGSSGNKGGGCCDDDGCCSSGAGGGKGGCCDDDACHSHKAGSKKDKKKGSKKGGADGESITRLEVHSLMDAASDLLMPAFVELLGPSTAGKPRIRNAVMHCVSYLTDEQYIRPYHFEGESNAEMRRNLVSALLDTVESKAMPGQAKGAEQWWTRVCALSNLAAASSRIPQECLSRYDRIKAFALDTCEQALAPASSFSSPLIAIAKREMASMSLQMWTCLFLAFKAVNPTNAKGSDRCCDHDHHDHGDHHDHHDRHHHHESALSVPQVMASMGHDPVDLKLCLDLVSKLAAASQRAYRESLKAASSSPAATSSDGDGDGDANDKCPPSKLESAALTVTQNCALCLQRIIEVSHNAGGTGTTSDSGAAVVITTADIFSSSLPFIVECGSMEAKPSKIRVAVTFQSNDDEDDEDFDPDAEDSDDDDSDHDDGGDPLAGAMKRLRVISEKGAKKDDDKLAVPKDKIAGGDDEDAEKEELEEEEAANYTRSFNQSSEAVSAVYFRGPASLISASKGGADAALAAFFKKGPSSSSPASIVVLKGLIKGSRLSAISAALGTLRTILQEVAESSTASSAAIISQIFDGEPQSPAEAGDPYASLSLVLRQLVCVIKQGCRSLEGDLRENASNCSYLLLEAARRWIDIRSKAGGVSDDSEKHHKLVLSYIVKALFPALCDAMDLCVLAYVPDAGERVTIGQEVEDEEKAAAAVEKVSGGYTLPCCCS
jgi:hypothetical protein